MKNANWLILFLAAVMSVITAPMFEVCAAQPHHTPLSLMPKSLASSSLKTAGVYWLPDYLKNNAHRGSDDPGGGDRVLGCEIYGLLNSCEAPRQSGGKVYPRPGLVCHKSCSCSAEYRYNAENCSGDYEVSGDCCDGFCQVCVCKKEFIYNDALCVAPAVKGGGACEGLFRTCECPQGYSTEVLSCGKGQQLLQQGSISGKGCYKCGCEERFDLTVCPPGAVCEQCGDKFDKQGCEDGFYEENGECKKIIPCPQGTSLTPACDEEHKATESGYYSGGEVCYRCEAKSCDERGLKVCDGQCIALNECCQCSDEQKCFDGSCIAKTCADKGMKDCNGSCIALNECCGGCATNQKCVNGECVDKTCKDDGLKDCNGSCIALNECCGGCATNQKCINGECVDKTCKDDGLKDCNGSCIALNECCGGCAAGEICANGSCVCKNECKLASCPAGTLCREEACSGKFCAIGCMENYMTPINYLYLFYLL